MGISGLLSFIESNIKPDDNYDLANIGTKESPIEILVDTNNFVRYLIKTISIKISNDYNNKNLLFPTGEYDILKNAFCDFHSVFKNIGINLVWILDGPKVFHFLKYFSIKMYFLIFYNRELMKLLVVGNRKYGQKDTMMTLNTWKRF